MVRPEVSVVMPAYNSEALISSSIRSVLNQTFENWELLVVDDGSVDKTSSIVRQFVKMDKRVRYFRTINGGPGRARNLGIQESRARYIAFLDSDDEWMPEKLEWTIDFSSKVGSTITYTDYVVSDSHADEVSFRTFVPNRLKYEDILRTNSIAMSTVIVDRSQVPDFALREDVHFDDYVAWLKILRLGGSARGLNQPLTRYRIGHASFSTDKLKAALAVWKIYRKVEELSVAKSLFYFCNYGFNGLRKHRNRFKALH